MTRRNVETKKQTTKRDQLLPKDSNQNNTFLLTIQPGRCQETRSWRERSSGAGVGKVTVICWLTFPYLLLVSQKGSLGWIGWKNKCVCQCVCVCFFFCVCRCVCVCVLVDWLVDWLIYWVLVYWGGLIVWFMYWLIDEDSLLKVGWSSPIKGV